MANTTYVVRAKPGVRFDTIAPAGFELLAAIALLPKILKRDVWITCGTDSHHLPDPHCSGEAYDLSVLGWTADQIQKALDVFRAMGAAFYAQYEVPSLPSDPTLRKFAVVNPNCTGPHLHTQRARGTVYPSMVNA